MKTTIQHTIKLLLLCGLLLGWSGSAEARNLVANGVGVVQSLNDWAPLSAADNITVEGGALLVIDNPSPETIGNLTIGGAGATSGRVRFDGTARTLTVEGNVVFSANAANELSMLFIPIPTVAHTLRVKGQFLQNTGGLGTFVAGNGTVEYANDTGAQNVNGVIGGGPVGTIIDYKNLTLSGGSKTLGQYLSIYGKLNITGTATVTASPSPIYGPNASLTYSGTGTPQNTSTEWPDSPTVLTVPVTVDSVNGLRLNAHKTSGGTLLINQNLNDDGKTLTAQNVVWLASGKTVTGPGKLVLGGTTAQLIVCGTGGSFGNIQLDNTAGATAILPLIVSGRVTITNGRLTFNTPSSTAGFLTYGSPATSKSGGTYGSVASGATTQDDAVFGGAAAGHYLTVSPLPNATITSASPTMTYGDNDVTVSGSVTGGSPGNGVVAGEQVTVTITLPSPAAPLVGSVGIQANGTFSVTILTRGAGPNPPSLVHATLPPPRVPHPITIAYAGGVNLAPKTDSTSYVLNVNQRLVTLIGKAGVSAPYSYVYGQNIPLSGDYDHLSAQVLPSDILLQAAPTLLPDNRNVGTHDIILSGWTTAQNSEDYVIGYATPPATVEITSKTINVTVTSGQSKIYGDGDPVAGFAYTHTPLEYTDSFSGALDRVAGETVTAPGPTYAIGRGSLGLSANYTFGTFTPADFTINKRTATYTAHPQQKIYGDGDPPLTGVAGNLASGTVNGHTFSDTVEGSLTRVAGEDVGSRQIQQGGVVVSPAFAGNYAALAYTSDNLVIGQRAITISAVSPNPHMPYGGPVPDLVAYGNLASFGTPPVPRPPVPGATVTGGATLTDVPGDYQFTVVPPVTADPNYGPVSYGTLTGTLVVDKAPLTITAENKTKAYGDPVPTLTAAYTPGFKNGETAAVLDTQVSLSTMANALSGVGTYPITAEGATDGNYEITHVNGTLTVTGPNRLINRDDLVWAGGESFTWQIDQLAIPAPGGTPGASPGWDLVNIAAGKTFTISATAATKFTLKLKTVPAPTFSPGPLPHFDPTRSNSWKIVQSPSAIILGAPAGDSVPSRFTVDTTEFANLTYGGTFSLALGTFVGGDNTSLHLIYTPDPAPDVTALRNSLTVTPGSDLDVLWLEIPTGSPLPANIISETDTTVTIRPNAPITVNLNVAHLRQPVAGLQAVLRFSSTYFTLGTVISGSATWNELIVSVERVAGDLDVAVGVLASTPTATSADNIAVKIQLIPKRVPTLGTPTRVVFRLDPLTDPFVANSTVLSSLGGSIYWPARIPSKEINIIADDTWPVIGTITAVQDQTRGGGSATENVMDPAKVTVRGTATPAGTAVKIAVTATDNQINDTGLNGRPSVRLQNPSTLAWVTAVNAGGTPPVYNYTWDVIDTTPNGLWNVEVKATDNVGQTTTAPNFTLNVNRYEISGSVELELLSYQAAGQTRLVRFAATAGGDATKTWDRTLNFTADSQLLPPGAINNLAGLVNKLKATPSTAVASWDYPSAYLYWGDISTDVNLVTVVNNLKNIALVANHFLANTVAGQTLSAQTKADVNGYPGSPSVALTVNLRARLIADFRAAMYSGQSIHTNAPVAVRTAITNMMGNASLRRGTTLTLWNTYKDAVVPGSATAEQMYTFNRQLIEDALQNGSTPSVYLGPKLTYADQATVTAQGATANPALDTTLRQELNLLILNGASLQNATGTRFPGTLRTETTTLQALGSRTAAQTARLNRLLIEDVYDQTTLLVVNENDIICRYVTMYTLLDVPAGTTAISAKTAWNLREKLLLSGSSSLVPSVPATVTISATTPTGYAFFCGDGVPLWNNLNDTVDHFLRGGDIRSVNVPESNSVNIQDYGLLRSLWQSTGAAAVPADINGDGTVESKDYGRIQANWFKNGDLE